MIGEPINILIPPNLQREEEVILHNIKSGNKIDHFQTIRLGKMGNEIPVSITVSPVKDKLGHIIGTSKIARDVSEQLQREYTIQQAARRLQMLNSIGKAISERSCSISERPSVVVRAAATKSYRECRTSQTECCEAPLRVVPMLAFQAMISCTTLPETSVRRKSRPVWR